jgi:N-acetylglutamate synthase-like GNAT family acetyltransferase
MRQPRLESRHRGTVRNATILDTREISRLLGKAAAVPTNTLDLLEHGHLLVLEVNKNTLGAAVHVGVADNHATVNLLVVDPALQGQHVAERMSGVARALCEAYGYAVDESTGTSPRATSSRGRQ